MIVVLTLVAFAVFVLLVLAARRRRRARRLTVVSTWWHRRSGADEELHFEAVRPPPVNESSRTAVPTSFAQEAPMAEAPYTRSAWDQPPILVKGPAREVGGLPPTEMVESQTRPPDTILDRRDRLAQLGFQIERGERRTCWGR